MLIFDKFSSDGKLIESGTARQLLDRAYSRRDPLAIKIARMCEQVKESGKVVEGAPILITSREEQEKVTPWETAVLWAKGGL